MKPRLSKAASQLREQVDDSFPDRSRLSDGWIADARHLRAGKSDHIPDEQGWVRFKDQSQMLWVTLLINYGKPVDPSARTAFLTSSLMVAFVPASLTGNGEHTRAQTSTQSTLISALRKRLTYWVSFIRYLC
jgi:hypothetical protein